MFGLRIKQDLAAAPAENAMFKAHSKPFLVKRISEPHQEKRAA